MIPGDVPNSYAAIVNASDYKEDHALFLFFSAEEPESWRYRMMMRNTQDLTLQATNGVLTRVPPQLKVLWSRKQVSWGNGCQRMEQDMHRVRQG